jgi:hypothetical protein
MASVRARGAWLAAAALIGATAGLFLSGPSGYEVTALMQLTQTNQDSLRIKQLGQTLERTGTSSAVVNEAVSTGDVTATDLAGRLNVVWEEDTDVVAISVRGPSADGLVDEANAVAEAIMTVSGRQADAQIDAIRDAGDRVVETGQLSDDRAEAARRAQLGTTIAAQQDQATLAATPAVLVAPASDPEATGITRSTGAALGAFAAVALAAGIALLVPFRRRRVRKLRDVKTFLPNVRPRAREGVAGEVAGMLTESGRQDLAVLAVGDTDSVAHSIAQEVVELLRSHGLRAAISPSDMAARGPAPFPVYGAAWRRNARGLGNLDVLVTVARADDQALSLLDGQSSVHAVVVVKAGKHSILELRGVTSRLEHADPTVVLVP